MPKPKNSKLASTLATIASLAMPLAKGVIKGTTTLSSSQLFHNRNIKLPPKKVVKTANVQRMNRILQGTSGLITQSKFNLRKPANKRVALMEQIVPTKVFTTNYPLQHGVSAGFQNALVDRSLGWDELGQINSLLPATFSATNEGPKRCVIKGYDKVYTITNNTNATVELDIYDIVLRKDVPKNQSVLSNGLYYNLNGASPWTYWQQGTLASEGATSTSTPTPAEFLGCIPSDSQFFKDYFKVLQKKTLHLPLGSGHRHYVNLTPNWLVQESEMTSTVYDGLAGHTVYVMMVLRGFPVTDASGALVTSSSGTLSLVVSKRVRYCFVQDNRASGYYLDGLTTPADGDQQFINAASGAIDVIQRI